MENKSHALAAGAFVLVVATLLVAMAVWLTRDTVQRRSFEISSREAVTGLQAQAGVRYKGVAVGKVASIGLDRQTPGNVLVRIAVDDAVPVTRSTFASLGFQGVTGLAFIALDDSGLPGAALEATEPDLPRIPMRPGLMARLSDQGASMLTQLEQASHQANALLAADNQKTLMTAIANLGQAAEHISALSQHADRSLTVQAQTTLKSVQATSERLAISAEAVRNSADEFKRLSARMNQAGGTLDQMEKGAGVLAATGQSVNATLLPQLRRATGDAARGARQVGRVADMVQEQPQALLWGKGAPLPGPGEPGFVVSEQK